MHDAFPLPDVAAEPARPFWAAAARDALALPRCPRCDSFVWYPRPHCGGDDLQWEDVSGHGTLFAWTVVRHAFLPAFADLVPFVPALVAVDEDPAVRLVTRIVDADPASLRADQPVHVAFANLAFPGIDATVRAPFFTPSG